MQREVALATGTLSLRVDRSTWPLDALCDFATRRNPRRAFLIVSKVLGRHIPAAPSLMRAAMRDLAAQIPDLPGPVLVVGLAETAVCLGQGVHEELALRPNWRGVYIHSTRQQVDAPLLCRFQEPHSHASAHLIYDPAQADLGAFRSLVLVDDEVSTGTTLRNLAAALAGALPGLDRIAVATLTDWSGDGEWLAAMPHPAICASLLSGALAWTPGEQHAPEAVGFAAAAPRLGTLASCRNFGRFGVTPADPIALPDVPVTLGARLRVIGTGEFTYPPFLLAESLEARGHDVVVQSTTRSPVLPGGAIRHMLTFADNYATGVPNYLYNADSAEERQSLICHETGPDSIDGALIQALNATCIGFGEADGCEQ